MGGFKYGGGRHGYSHGIAGERLGKIKEGGKGRGAGGGIGL